MTVNLNPGKPNAILKEIEHFEDNSKTKIRELAFVIVSLISLSQVATLKAFGKNKKQYCQIKEVILMPNLLHQMASPMRT